MTTDCFNSPSGLGGCVILAAAAALVISCFGTSSVRYGDRVDVSRYPADIQQAYAVFAVRCSRCHTLARPLNANIRDPDHWVRYVTRMRRNPSSGINPKDAEVILQFLLYYTQQLSVENAAASGATSEPTSLPGAAASEGPAAAPRVTPPEPHVAEPVSHNSDRRTP